MFSKLNIQTMYDLQEEKINYLTCPTPTRLMGKSREEVCEWRIQMDHIQKSIEREKEDYQHINKRRKM
jgi:hypothetical protein